VSFRAKQEILYKPPTNIIKILITVEMTVWVSDFIPDSQL